jgi:phage/plasmid-associated DNA primase
MNALNQYCKDILRKYLNYENYLLGLKDEEHDHVYVDGVWVGKEALINAFKGDFTLSRELKLLKNAIFDTQELYRDLSFFQTPSHLLPCYNGYYDFERGEFSDYDGITVMNQVNARYVAEYADGPLPALFCDILWNGLSDMQLLMQYGPQANVQRFESFLDFLAYAFLPKNFARKLFMIIGPTKSGKSTLVNVMRTIFGDYGITLNSHSIMHRPIQHDGELRADLYDAMDKRWIDIPEIDERQTLDAVTIKTFTGQDKMNVRRAYSRQRISREMNGKIFIVTNFFPKITKANDEALQERLIIIDWHNTVKGNDVDEKLYDKLTTDEMRDRIFSFLVKRAEGIYRKNKLTVHPSFSYNTYRYFMGQGDLIAKFYDEVIIKGFPGPICFSVATIYECFKYYLQRFGKTPQEIPQLREFAMKFAAIVKSDPLNMVHKVHSRIGNFFQGMQFPFEYGFIAQPLTMSYPQAAPPPFPPQDRPVYIFKSQKHGKG